MTLTEFQLLSQTEKLDLLYKDGVYIGKCMARPVPTLLYQLEGFYVELHYTKYRSSIKCIYCFTNTDFLDPYLEQIEIALLV
jgi:hypothetical protein